MKLYIKKMIGKFKPTKLAYASVKKTPSKMFSIQTDGCS